MGAADERLQGTGRGSCESGIDLRLSEEVRAENCSDCSHIVQSCGRIVHNFVFKNFDYPEKPLKYKHIRRISD